MQHFNTDIHLIKTIQVSSFELKMFQFEHKQPIGVTRLTGIKESNIVFLLKNGRVLENA